MKSTLSPGEMLEDKYANQIIPFWQNQVIISKFNGKQDIQIVYAFALHPSPKDALVISPGRIESILKYQEVIFDFYQLGYSVFILDHRGQGLSGRMLDNTHKGFVEAFDEYVYDLKAFVQQVVLAKTKQTPLFLCHSMGGAIGALFGIQNPDLVKKMAFCAPMFGIQPVMPGWLSQFLLTLFFTFHDRADYFWGQKNYEKPSFDDNKLTHCQQRYRYLTQSYLHSPETQLGGVTGNWLQAAFQAMKNIEQQASNFSVPSLVLQAGADKVVDNKRQKQVALTFPNCQFLIIPEAKHELLMESDKYRVPSIEAIHYFFTDNLN